MIRKACEKTPALYLTFDDGPHPEFTPRILDVLDLFQARATFFVLGEACLRHPELVRQIQSAGHTLGCHTFSHRHPWLMSESHARQEVRDGVAALLDTCGEAPRLFRPPYGRKRSCMLEEATFLGMETVLWTRSAIDWGMLADFHSVAARLGKAQAGDILLCHDAPRQKNQPAMTLAVLPAFLESSQRRGLSFLNGQQLLDVVGRESGGRSLSQAQSV